MFRSVRKKLKLSQRRCTLFSVALCEVLFSGWDTCPRCEQALRAVELEADATEAEPGAWKASLDHVHTDHPDHDFEVAATVRYSFNKNLPHMPGVIAHVVLGITASYWSGDTHALIVRRKAELRRQSGILVDLIGPGWEFSQEWKTSTAIALAGKIYSEKAWGDCPILADALMDTGMPEDHKAIRYLRGDEQKFRGCWALDKILGKG